MDGGVTFGPALPGEENRLRELWKVCFGDEDWYIDGFFRGRYRPGQAMTLRSGGEIVSMLLVFSREMRNPAGQALTLRYVYAFCTHPDAQGRGFGRRLLAWTEGRAARTGARGVVMVPGERSLFDFYGTLGYETFCSLRERVITRDESPEGLPVTPCSPEEYQTLRAEQLAGRWWMDYPRESLDWQARLCADSGGGLYRVGDGIAAVERWGGDIVIKELLSRAPDRAARSLLAALGGTHALVREPVPAGEEGKPFGVIKWLDPAARNWWRGGEEGYLAFAFD